MAKEVSIEEYRSEWLQQFEQEREKLRTAFDDKAVAIEHIIISENITKEFSSLYERYPDMSVTLITGSTEKWR